MNILVLLASVLVLISVLTYFLVPAPLLSYQQGQSIIERGMVTKITCIRPGVFEVGITSDLKIDPKLQDGAHMKMVSATVTSYVHFRGAKNIPKVGDRIGVRFVNRFHHFTSRSFNWVKAWNPISEIKSVAGIVVPGLEEGDPAAVWSENVTGVFFEDGKIETILVTVNSVSGHLLRLARRNNNPAMALRCLSR